MSWSPYPIKGTLMATRRRRKEGKCGKRIEEMREILAVRELDEKYVIPVIPMFFSLLCTDSSVYSIWWKSGHSEVLDPSFCFLKLLWSSKLQTTIALSTTEADCRAAPEGKARPQLVTHTWVNSDATVFDQCRRHVATARASPAEKQMGVDLI